MMKDKLTKHELTDRLCTMVDMWSLLITDHQLVENNKELFERAQKIADDIYQMYNDSMGKDDE